MVSAGYTGYAGYEGYEGIIRIMRVNEGVMRVCGLGGSLGS